MRTPIGAIVFDFDGTLVDASDAICAAFDAVLRANELARWEPDRVRSTIGRPLRLMFAEADPGASADAIERYVQQYRGHFFPLSRRLTRALPCAEELVRRWEPRAKLAIATSRMADGARWILEGMRLEHLFGAIVGMEHVHHPKPHPEPVLRALEAVAVAPEHAVMIGDTGDDMRAGRAAGLWAIGVTTGWHGRGELLEAGAHEVVATLCEARGLLEAGRAAVG
jgi:phosphoglycolate phosphatase